MTLSISAADLALLNAGKSVTLQGPQAAPTPAPAPKPAPAPTPAPTPSGTFGAKIVGGKLVDLSGKPLRLKGVNVSGFESVAIQGWDPADPSGGITPNWAVLRAKGFNAVRVPFNTASWNGDTTYDMSGKTRDPDPGNNYRAAYKKFVDAATAERFYSIVDEHWSAPHLPVPGQANKVPFSPMGQGPGPDPDTSLPMWTSVANEFKDNPAVVFDLFTEWMANDYGGVGGTDWWLMWRNGGPLTKFPNNTGGTFDYVTPSQITGMQTCLETIRGTGSTNVVMAGGINWASDPSGWLSHVLTDPLKQRACSVHIYPTFGATFGTPQYNTLPTAIFAELEAIQKAGYPVIVGEVGGHCVAGTKGEPFTKGVLDWADSQGVHVFAWTWNVWTNPDNVLIKDAQGTPTDGFGQVVQTWAAA